MMTFDDYSDPKWNRIPLYMRDAVRFYIEEGRLPGHFLQALLCNDLFRAVERADDTNIRLLPAYTEFFYNHAPHDCYGGPAIVKAWVAQRGLKGE